MTRRFVLSAPLVWAAMPVRGAEKVQATWKALEDLCLQAPPGIAADGLLRLAGLAPRDLTGWKRALVEECYGLATGCRTPLPTRPAPVGFTDTVPAMSAIASRLGV